MRTVRFYESEWEKCLYITVELPDRKIYCREVGVCYRQFDFDQRASQGERVLRKAFSAESDLKKDWPQFFNSKSDIPKDWVLLGVFDIFSRYKNHRGWL